MNAELLPEKTAALSDGGDAWKSNTGDLSKVRVSCFANAYATEPEGTGATLAQIAADVRGEGTFGQQLAKDTANVRRLLAEANRDKRDARVDAAKKALPCFTASGRFTKRSKAHLTQHTGIIQADFDHVPDIPKLKALLAADPHVVMNPESCTGTGVKGFFHVQPPDTDDPAVLIAWHEKNAFVALTNYCQHTFGFRIDQQCVDASRLCFEGHDPDVVTNWNAEPLDVEAWLNPAGTKVPPMSVLAGAKITNVLDSAAGANTQRFADLGDGAKANICSDLNNGSNLAGAKLHIGANLNNGLSLNPPPVIRTADDATRAKVLAKALNKDRFVRWAMDRGFGGDLRTLDLRKVLVDAGIAEPADADEDKIFVRCPWQDQHTTRGNGTDVVVFRDPDTKGFPWTFHCSHAHCADKEVTSLLDWLEQRTPGCVDAACAKTYEPEATDPSFNDAGRADRFVARYGRDLRFVPEREVWLTWQQDRWKPDTDGAVERLAVRMSQAMMIDAGKIPGTDEGAAKLRATAVREALACGDRRNIADFIHLARINPRVLLSVDKLDADPWVVGAANWLMDLRTGVSRAYTREDFVTRPLACAVDPNATCPRWNQFMAEVFPDEQVRHFVHKAVGYTLTGAMREQVFFFLHGVGRNGKSVFVRTLEKYVFGKLSVRAGRGITATTERGGYPATEVAELAGARMILTSETEQGQKLNENVIKDLSGGDAMRGRNLYENAFTFLPVGKLWIVGNHKPTIRGTDGGIWRRVRLIPFTQKFEGDADDRQLPDKLAAEASGILNWAVRGCLLWQREGLEMPDVIRAAVDEYKRDEDRLADFIEDTVTESRAESIKHADLFKAYQRHCEDHGNRPWTSRALAKALRERGWRSESTWESKCVWVGYALNAGESDGHHY